MNQDDETQGLSPAEVERERRLARAAEIAGCLGCLSVLACGFGLIYVVGVPMMEASLLNRPLGWSAIAVAGGLLLAAGKVWAKAKAPDEAEAGVEQNPTDQEEAFRWTSHDD